jgi:hypothetical protein
MLLEFGFAAFTPTGLQLQSLVRQHNKRRYK